ncbi:MAG: DUF4388 domain-containing protein [Syntrophorhabdales bacterium]|jgi:hypothetical protein
MPNDFVGDLSKTRLFDLLRPLLTGKKSGMVLIRGSDVGEVHIEGGNIVHAKTGRSTGEEAILAMMEWDAGQVTFDWQVTSEERTVSTPTEELLESWIAREKEWKKIAEVISSSNTIFRIPFDNASGDKKISAAQWKVLALSDGTRTIGEIAEALEWQLFETSRIAYEMVQDGLLEKASEKAPAQKPPRKIMNGNFFPRMEHELKRIMGPIAPIILEDKMAEFGESIDAFPENRVQPFVQAVGEEIADNSKRAVFTRVMTELLARLQH